MRQEAPLQERTADLQPIQTKDKRLAMAISQTHDHELPPEFHPGLALVKSVSGHLIGDDDCIIALPKLSVLALVHPQTSVFYIFSRFPVLLSNLSHLKKI